MAIIHPGILEVRAPALNFFVLRDERGLYIVDGGFVGGIRLLQKTLRLHGWQREPICGIIVTHGHLDHILNVRYLAETHQAWIAAPKLDADHYAGRPKYHGQSRVTGWLEAIGRVALAYRKFTPERWLKDGDQLNIFSGMKVVHLPGHTAGHVGFWIEEARLLLTGDLFVSYTGSARLPLGIFNADSDQNLRSIGKALALKPDGVLPNHGSHASPQEHLRRMTELYQRHRHRVEADHS